MFYIVSRYKGHVVLALISLLLGCADDQSEASQVKRWEIEGPQGLVKDRGPWLVRTSFYLENQTTALRLKVFEVLQDQEEAEPVNQIERASIEVLKSARDDLAFALIPQLETEIEYEYALWRGEQKLTESNFFRPIQVFPPTETESNRNCFIQLESPDPKLPVSAEQDEAPQAGIQRSYTIRIFPVLDGEVDLQGSESLMGLASFEWLSADSSSDQKGIVAEIYGGLARSKPFTTALGEQKLKVTAFTTAWGKCEELVTFTSQ